MEDEKKEDLDLTINKIKEMLNKKQDIEEKLRKNGKASCTISTVTYIADITIREDIKAITNI